MSSPPNAMQEQNLRALTKTFTGLQKPLLDGKVPESLAELIAELHRVFEYDDVNIEYVNHLLLSYKPHPAEWKRFAKFDRYRYTRNLVDAGNGKFNLMILCWGAGHGSAIHDHADAHCFMKMLKGGLVEIRYAWPTASESTTAPPNATPEAEPHYSHQGLHELGRSTMEENDVVYINDSLGLHRVENASHTDGAVSLHLYCPPFDSCSIFHQDTGKRSTVTPTFWSEYGERRNKSATISASPEDN